MCSRNCSPSRAGTCCVPPSCWPAARRMARTCSRRHSSEGFARLRRLQAAVEIDGGLDVAVPEQAPHDLIFPRPVLQNDRGTCMAELMDSDSNARDFLNALGDLGAEHV